MTLVSYTCTDITASENFKRPAREWGILAVFRFNANADGWFVWWVSNRDIRIIVFRTVDEDFLGSLWSLKRYKERRT
ncbi:hypothetical protein Nepgr_013245 [Nepenthes gracilis]|uniref:Uncharacterized protein n=1 Tax=Nepenthes gracilis TaxID=150966 RepID=A0AAD3SIV3_NEPGR|nr:hypothetical protein Nepgr_013245 [Nepenthes gracilis]